MGRFLISPQSMHYRDKSGRFWYLLRTRTDLISPY
nr:MAG TPA: hypothetical protein [Crassvirales sp.]